MQYKCHCKNHQSLWEKSFTKLPWGLDHLNMEHSDLEGQNPNCARVELQHTVLFIGQTFTERDTEPQPFRILGTLRAGFYHSSKLVNSESENCSLYEFVGISWWGVL